MLCSKSYSAAGFTLGGHEVDLFPAEFPGVLLLWMQDLISGAMQFKHFFFGSEGGRPRSSNDEFALEESASLFQSAGRIGKKTQDREIWLQKK